MKYLLLLFIVFAFLSTVYGQQNTTNVWYFGEHCGLNFNTGVPVALTDGVIDTDEGCSTICDAAGNLLFYSDGMTIWNKNHIAMMNGTGLMGNSSASQAVLIAPYPYSDSLFFVFTVDARENSLLNGFCYSIVDLSLDNGLGGVTAIKNIQLHTPVSEKLIMIPKPNLTDFWVIVHEWNSDAFLAYSVDSNGIDTIPVISNIGGTHTGGTPSQLHAVGCMKANLNGDKIAVANFRDQGYFELFDFNVTNGVISNAITSPNTYYRPFGVEFSPNGQYLYGSIDGGSSGNGKLYQFDLQNASPLGTSILVGSSARHISGLQIAPNGKIYASIRNSTYIAVIDKPDLAGTNCNFIHDGFFLNGGITWRGLPTIYIYKGFEFFTGSVVDTAICSGDSILLEGDYQSAAGTFYDQYISSQGWDSIVTTHLSILPAPGLPPMYENTGVLSTIASTGYQWYFNGNLITGATTQYYTPFVTGYYQVEVFNSYGCSSFSEPYYFVYTKTDFNSIIPVSVHPNPFSDHLIIELEGTYTLEITDIYGKTIIGKEQYSGKEILQLQCLANAVYFLRICSRDKSWIIPLIKNQ